MPLIFQALACLEPLSPRALRGPSVALALVLQVLRRSRGLLPLLGSIFITLQQGPFLTLKLECVNTKDSPDTISYFREIKPYSPDHQRWEGELGLIKSKLDIVKGQSKVNTYHPEVGTTE